MASLIYERIMEMIEAKKSTRAKVENAAGLGNGTIESWKNGNPSIKKLEAVAKVLECKVTDLIQE